MFITLASFTCRMPHFMTMFPSIARLMNLVLMVIFMNIILDAKLSTLHIFVMINQTIA